MKSNTLVLRGATLIDGTGRDAITDAIVVIEGNRIAAVGRREETFALTPDARLLNLSGKWLIPGLINCHDHLFCKAIRYAPPGIPLSESRQKLFNKPDMYLTLESAHNALDELHQGVTTIRDLGARHGMAIHLRNAIADGLMPGPRILAAGEAITMTGGHFYPVSRQADGPDEVRKAVREQLHANADCIKLMASGGLAAFPKESPGLVQYTDEELRAGVEEAHKAGKLATAHAQAAQAIRNAVEAGVDCIEHGHFLDSGTIQLMVERGTDLVPTLSALINYISTLRSVGDADLAERVAREIAPKHVDGFRRAVNAGITIGAGTDSPALMAEELEAMVAAGLSPAEALRTATRDGAVVCGIEHETGTIEPGKHADLVILKTDPLRDIRAVREVAAVFREGAFFQLDASP